ncbi:MAG: exonuclease SbcCD subunit D [Bacillota bacterium]|nr:exonuclease SbcCD subunit D [Bacillota bacterium]
MKFVHLSDLHIGKRVNEYPMIEDQKYILGKILEIIDEEKPDAVFISGDVYDKPVPPAEAVQVFDSFLVSLADRKLDVFVISGNHDSPERVAFGSRLMDSSGIHISPVYEGNVEPRVMKDSYGEIGIYMLPFIKPAHVRRFYPEEEIVTYTDAVKCALKHMGIDCNKRNIILTHQFVTGALRSDSEEISVGGSDNVDAAAFEDFDYTALGHIHRPQNIGSEKIRYCGTPLKYSVSEAGHVKSVTVGELKEKGSLTVREIPLVPLRDVRTIKGNYQDIAYKGFYENTTFRDDYMHIILTDEDDIPDAVGKLRTIYRNLIKLEYDNRRTRENSLIEGAEDTENRTPLELFGEFFELQNNSPMSDEQREYMEKLIEEVWGVSE